MRRSLQPISLSLFSLSSSNLLCVTHVSKQKLINPLLLSTTGDIVEAFVAKQSVQFASEAFDSHGRMSCHGRKPQRIFESTAVAPQSIPPKISAFSRISADVTLPVGRNSCCVLCALFGVWRGTTMIGTPTSFSPLPTTTTAKQKLN